MSTPPGGDFQRPLLQIHEPRRRFLGPLVLVIAAHVGLTAWVARRPPPPRPPPPEPVKVALQLPPRKLAVNEPPGGGPKRPPPPARRARARRHIQPPKVIPPPVVETPPLPPPPEPPRLAEAEEAGDDDDGEGDPDALPGPGGGGGGSGTGTGPGTGPGRGSVRSKARRAWLSHTDWRCRRPGYDELGRIVVRLRVEVLPDGKPGEVTVVKAGPQDFNRRAVDCALDETYLPALDPEGRPIRGSCEFSIEFLN